MSELLYDIRRKFSYTITTSSIEYIRNYNFNTSTVSDIALEMANSDDTIPITVNMTTTDPWIRIVNPTSGVDLKYPNGNVVLQPTSSTVVLVKIDLPPEIESIPESTIYPNIVLDIKSGSFPIIAPAGGGSEATTNTIIPENNIYYLQIGERISVNITVYDAEGNQDLTAAVNWRSNNSSVVQVEEPQNTEVDYNPYTPRIIRGISPGETTVTISADDNRTATIAFIVREPAGSDSSGGATRGTARESSGGGRADNSTDTFI